MKEDTQDQLAELTREAFRKLAEKHRAAIFRKAGHASLDTITTLVELAHIPPSFQPNKIERWFRPEHQRAFEKLVLSAEYEPLFHGLLHDFFCLSHPQLNEHLSTLLEAEGSPSSS